jgi:GTP-binding protein Era
MVAIVGRPNVGKSTLMNHLIGQKISITSRKPQTTRHRILGINTDDAVQTIYVDTPGIHDAAGKALNRRMNRSALSALRDVDLVVFVVERLIWTEADQRVLERLQTVGKPVLLAINKIDELEDKTALLPWLAEVNERHAFSAIVPVSALKGHNLEGLRKEIAARLPEGEHLYGADQVTDRSERFMVAEIVREKLTRQLGEELPYASTVQIEEFRHQGPVVHISALVLVDKPGQKAIVIGHGGARLKRIGSEARLDIERLLDSKVMLKLWVKVKSGWADDERTLKSLGYGDDDERPH